MRGKSFPFCWVGLGLRVQDQNSLHIFLFLSCLFALLLTTVEPQPQKGDPWEPGSTREITEREKLWKATPQGCL